ncbi:MAG: glycosyltransferase [Armatimonadetes bacterium]|nr:glycosyltransferase [Armatimonadota bacterium]
MAEIKAVVFLGMNPWDHQKINDTVRLLARAMTGVDRLYVDPPLGIRAALAEPAYFFRSLCWRREVSDGIERLSPPFGFLPVRGGLRGLANALCARGLAGVLASRYGSGWRRCTLFYVSSWSYTQAGMLAGLRPVHLFFHLLDDTFAFPQIVNDPAALAVNKSFFNYLMKESSVVAAVSAELAEKYQLLYGRKISVLRNGVDVEHFGGTAGRDSRGGARPDPGQGGGRAGHRPAAEAADEAAAELRGIPPELRGIPRPLLMYAGSINSWLDVALLKELADLRPQYSLVLIGHYYPGTVDPQQWAELLARPNVHWLSSRPYAALPAYLQAAAALLLPRTTAEHSLKSDPLKLYEYLATGRPVVSTALPAVAEFRDYVYVGTTAPDLAGRIDLALREHSAEKARRQKEAVREHSWAARAQEVLRLIQNVHRDGDGWR